MMNVAFIVNKRVSLKFFKDIINVLLEKNYNIFLLFDYTTDRQKGKWREFPSLDAYQNEDKNIIKKQFLIIIKLLIFQRMKELIT